MTSHEYSPPSTPKKHLTMVPAVEDTARLLLRGQQNRHTAATNMNRESSRSHSVFTCLVESKTTDEAGFITMLSARVNLVDLAGDPSCLSLASVLGSLHTAC